VFRRVGRFEYSPAKFFKKTHAEELEGLSREERKAKIIAYHIANRRRRRTAEEVSCSHSQRICFLVLPLYF